MATSSITTTVHIRTKRQAETFMKALEENQRMAKPQLKPKNTYVTIKKEEIKTLFPNL